jgi:hypothetical protein
VLNIKRPAFEKKAKRMRKQHIQEITATTFYFELFNLGAGQNQFQVTNQVTRKKQVDTPMYHINQWLTIYK